MKPLRSICLLATLCLAFQPTVQANAEFQTWEGLPIALRLQLGIPRQVQIEEAKSIRIGIAPKLQSILEIESIGNTLWITAHEDIEGQRVVAEVAPTGDLVVFAANTVNYAIEPVLTIDGIHPVTIDVNPGRELGFVEMTRWAVRRMYSPGRLQNDLPELTRYPLNIIELDLFRCGPNPPSACGGAVRATVNSVWRSPLHYLTIVSLQNKLDLAVILDPREIRGVWRTATFVRSLLTPAHDRDSSTILVLISDHPPEQAIRK